MNQLALLKIPKQPARKEPAIDSDTILAYVRESLRDFPRRQRERERLRKLKRRPIAEPIMRTIKVTYRAVFEQPIGCLNAMGLKLPGLFPVEIFGAGDRWKAREIQTARRQTMERLPEFQNPESGKKVVENSFTRKVKEWEMWGAPAGEEKVLIPGQDVADLGNWTWGVYGPEDRTHIVHGKHEGRGTPPAACGSHVSHKLFVSTRANVEPTCPECAAIYRREYAK